MSCCCGGKNACLICGEELEYFPDRHEQMTCEICGKTVSSNVCCINGQFVCDQCHGRKSVESVLSACREISSKNPAEIAQRLFENSFVHMHGPEHHILVGASLITAYYNSGGKLELDEALKEMTQRGSQVPGGTCGFWGGCGAALSAGISFSIISGTTPLSGESWGLCNLLTSRILAAMGNIGGPRCCKRTSFLSVIEASKFMNEHLPQAVETPHDVKCSFSHNNGECLKERCPFYVK